MKILDRKIISYLDNQFPLNMYPYSSIAEMVELSEEELLKRVMMYLEKGYIKRIGAIFSSEDLGYKNSLLCANVPKNRISEVIKILNNINGVTNIFLRDHEYNLWFNLTQKNERELQKKLLEIETKTEVKFTHLSTVKTFKLESTVDLGISDTEDKHRMLKDTLQLKDWERELIRILQNNIDIVHAPFQAVAERLSVDSDKVLDKVKTWVKQGVIKKFGAVLRTRNVEYKTNILLLSNLNQKDVQRIGRGLGERHDVSQCCLRTKPVNNSPLHYNFYSVFHVRNKDEGERHIRKQLQSLGVKDYSLVFTKKELKREGMKFFVE